MPAVMEKPRKNTFGKYTRPTTEDFQQEIVCVRNNPEQARKFLRSIGVSVKDGIVTVKPI